MFEGKVGIKSIKDYNYIKASKEGNNLRLQIPIPLEEETEGYDPQNDPYRNLKGIASPQHMKIKGYKKVDLNKKIDDEEINSTKLDERLAE